MIVNATLAPSPPSAKTTTTKASITQQEPKLTKKQKKALAFRGKLTKTVTRRKEDELTEMAYPGITLMEKSNRTRNKGDQMEMGGLEGKGPESSEGGGQETGKGKERARDVRSGEREQRQEERSRRIARQQIEDRTGKVRERTKKRKREQSDDGVDGAEQHKIADKNKKRKGEEVKSGLDQDKRVEKEGEGKGEGEEKMSETRKAGREGEGKEKQRFILFVGNLKYTTSVDTIKAHFSACDPPPDVRLLTPKTSSTGKTTIKSKGCAFLEFTARPALQQALKLHHSMLEGRMINVELTAGGGGKSEKRMEKVKERNKALLGQRKRRAEKKESRDGSLPLRPDKPQRYSATSGVEQSTPSKLRTWSVGDVTDDQIRRGGKRHKAERGSRKSRVKDWASGVNAIPVG